MTQVKWFKDGQFDEVQPTDYYCPNCGEEQSLEKASECSECSMPLAGVAHALGLRLVAEGVEDDATGAVLARLGCDVAQGYAIARPMPVEDFLRWLVAPRPPLLEQTRA